MTRFLLIRHAMKETIMGDAPLSPLGQQQAELTAHYLASRAIRAVYSSPLRRASETAHIIAGPHALPIDMDMRLRERANWGDLPGQSFDEFVAMWNRSTHDPAYVPPVGDSARAAGARLESFLREIARRAPAHSTVPEEEVVAVTHGGLITDFLATTFPPDVLDRWHPSFLAYQSELVPECSITAVRADVAASDGTPHYVLESFADTTHLAEEAQP